MILIKVLHKLCACYCYMLIAGQMRSLRLFYTDSMCTMGQVVIASRESQYKILHFHHGGLDKLAEIFNDWNLFAKMKDKVAFKIIDFSFGRH